MPSIAATIDRPVAIRQEITAGNQFDGTAPGAAPTFANDIYAFAPAAAGGLFDPTNTTAFSFPQKEALELIDVGLAMIGQSAWSLSMVDPDANERVLFSGTNETSFASTEETQIIVLPGAKLKLTTTGATGVMTASLVLQPHHISSRGR
jgi:hypothetical protein